MMKVLRSCFLLAVALLLGTAPAVAIEVDGYRVPGVHDAELIEQEQASLSSWLVSEQENAALQQPMVVSVTAEELAVMENIDSSGAAVSKLLVGVAKSLDAFVDLEVPEVGMRAAATKGVFVWSGAVRSDGASAIRLHFTDFALPPGAELYVYNESGEAFGPYTDKGINRNGEFWSHTITGSTVLIQARTPVGVGHGYFNIAEVAHFGPNFPYAEIRQRVETKALCSYNESCIQANSGTDDSIAHYSFVQRPYVYICTGGLIADEGQTGTPYFLTANHCVSRDRIASSVETYFFYTTNNGGCDGPVAQHTVGASVVATNKTSDFTLLELNGSAPSGSAFLGWTTDEVAFSNGTPLNRVSHPSGAPQAYSEHVVDTSAGTCSSWPRGDWIYSRDTLGATEGGSSGSPVLNSQDKIVGQLSGGCGTNVYVSCDSENNATVDGAFAAYYSQVAPFLGGGGSGCSDDLDGDGYIAESCGGNDCDDNEPFANPGLSEICDDQIDNNCDGTIDEGCGGGSCLPKGDPCTFNSECCSDRCHPRKLTCN
jgi:V8-like Glu-specific endopeptidase